MKFYKHHLWGAKQIKVHLETCGYLQKRVDQLPVPDDEPIAMPCQVIDNLGRQWSQVACARCKPDVFIQFHGRDA